MNLNHMFVSFLFVVVAVAFFSMSGCSTLSADQQKQIADACGPEFDCYVVKGDLWRQIVEHFKSQIGI